jgi:hypothetical protein
VITQLNPMIPVHVLGRGDGYAMAIIDYGQEHNLIWVTAITASGEIWCAPNPSVRMAKNWTMGRPGRSAAVATSDVFAGSPDFEALSKTLLEPEPTT